MVSCDLQFMQEPVFVHGVLSPKRCALMGAAINKQLHLIARSANAKVGCEVIPEKLTCHWMRHTFITDAIDAGVPAHVVAQYVGHDGPDVTMRVYYTCRRSSVEDAVALLNSVGDTRRAGELRLVGGHAEIDAGPDGSGTKSKDGKCRVTA